LVFSSSLSRAARRRVAMRYWQPPIDVACFAISCSRLQHPLESFLAAFVVQAQNRLSLPPRRAGGPQGSFPSFLGVVSLSMARTSLRVSPRRSTRCQWSFAQRRFINLRRLSNDAIEAERRRLNINMQCIEHDYNGLSMTLTAFKWEPVARPGRSAVNPVHGIASHYRPLFRLARNATIRSCLAGMPSC
jgi:hypothetical protein